MCMWGGLCLRRARHVMTCTRVSPSVRPLCLVARIYAHLSLPRHAPAGFLGFSVATPWGATMQKTTKPSTR